MNYNLLKLTIPYFLFILSVITAFFILGDEKVYKITLGKIAANYAITNGNITLEKVPYTHFSNDKMLHWDAAIFNRIKNDYYNEIKAGGDWISASFPLFPIVWKLAGLSATGIALFNYSLFIISIILFALMIAERKNILKYIFFSLAFPVLLPFLIPYSEAAFMFFFSISIAGLYKKKYWLYFFGMLFASMTRSAIVILFLSFLVTEILIFAKHRNFIFCLRELLLKILPAATGTCLAVSFQIFTGSNSIVSFIKAQKYWGGTFSIPHSITDWSHEGFGINIAIIFFLVAPACIYFFIHFFKNIFNKGSSEESVFAGNPATISNFLFHFSLIYFIGIFLFIFFFRGGCIYGIYRYISSTPLFIVFIFILVGKLSDIPVSYRAFFYGVLFFLAIFLLGTTPYTNDPNIIDPYWNFSDLGFFIFAATSGILIFVNELPEKIFYFLITSVILINILWHTYLLNMFLINAWISA